ncbi:GntR family transcriptional regulator [Monashia sp. NPDC004114]
MTLDKPISGRGVESAPARSPIEFRLDPASGVPTYLQLVRQVEEALLVGYLRRGDQLPKVREVVADLAINPNTVLKAYRELEHKGLASGRPGQGTFVEGDGTTATLPELAGLRRRLLRWLEEAEAAGLDESRVVALFSTTLRDFDERRRTSDAGGLQPGSDQVSGGVA